MKNSLRKIEKKKIFFFDKYIYSKKLSANEKGKIVERKSSFFLCKGSYLQKPFIYFSAREKSWKLLKKKVFFFFILYSVSVSECKIARRFSH